MREVLATTNIKREKDWLYYCATDENGNLIVCRCLKYQVESKLKGGNK